MADLLLVFLSILLSGTLINISQPFLIGILFATIVLASLLISQNTKVKRSVFWNILLIIFCIAVLFLGKYLLLSASQSILKYGFIFTNILGALLVLLYFRQRPESLTKSVYIVLYFIMLHALLSLLAWYVIGNSLSYSATFKTYTFSYLFYYVFTDSDTLNAMRTIEVLGIPFFRISGIFWEPGILQIYMNILLFLSLYIYPNTRVALLSALVIFTTWSSTGMVILLIQILFYVIHITTKKNIMKMLGLIGLFALMLIPVQENLMQKLEGQDSGSGYARALDTLTAINIIQNNPLFGIELDSEVYKQELTQNRSIVDMAGSNEARDAHDTNAILNYFVFFGIPLGLWILYSLYRQNIFPRYPMRFFIIMLIAMSTEPIGFFIFPLMLIFSTYILKKPERSANDE